MTRTTQRTPAARWTAVALFLAIGTTAMTCQPAEGFFVLNNTSQELTITIEGWDSPAAINDIPSGRANSFPILDFCEGSAVVATTADGQEYASAQEPACRDATWILDVDGARME